MNSRTGRTRRDHPPADEEYLQSENLKEEIRLLRELLHQTAASARPEAGASEQLRLLDVIGRACGQLARLLRTQAALGGPDELAEEIGRVADEVRRQIAGQVEV
jgi:hypothetical protein